MKAFTFRLEQALRWRETQVNLQKARVAAAAGRLAETEALLAARNAGLANAAARITDGPTGDALGLYAGFRRKSLAGIRDCEAQVLVLQRNLTLELNGLIEANRKLQLIENLKQTDRALWRKEFDRELAAFADEAFLSRIQSVNRRARSSGG
jgi:hypothetical protein